MAMVRNEQAKRSVDEISVICDGFLYHLKNSIHPLTSAEVKVMSFFMRCACITGVSVELPLSTAQRLHVSRNCKSFR